MTKGKGLLWGIDLGGTKIEGVVLNTNDPTEPLARIRVPTESHLGYDHILAQIEILVQCLESQVGIPRGPIGFGTPGTLDPGRGVIKNSNTLCLNGKPLDKDLSYHLKTDVRLANDANCFALAEATLGAVKKEAINAESVFGVIMGTGVGGGVVVNGKLLHGRQGIAGEWGHNFLDDEGGPCYCGKTGCVEKIISGPALEEFYFQKTGLKAPLKQILANCQQDPAARMTRDRLLYFFGKAIAVVINILDPEVIVLGGGLGTTPELYIEGVQEARKHLFNDRIDTLFIRPGLGDSAGVFGAAMLWKKTA